MAAVSIDIMKKPTKRPSSLTSLAGNTLNLVRAGSPNKLGTAGATDGNGKDHWA